MKYQELFKWKKQGRVINAEEAEYIEKKVAALGPYTVEQLLDGYATWMAADDYFEGKPHVEVLAKLTEHLAEKYDDILDIDIIEYLTI